MKMAEELLDPHQEPGVAEEEFAALEETYGVILPEDCLIAEPFTDFLEKIHIR